MATSSTRTYIQWQNLDIAMNRLVCAIGDNLAPAFRSFSDALTSLYDALRRAYVYDRLPAWLPWREQIAARWPRRWLPTGRMMRRWIERWGGAT